MHKDMSLFLRSICSVQLIQYCQQAIFSNSVNSFFLNPLWETISQTGAGSLTMDVQIAKSLHRS